MNKYTYHFKKYWHIWTISILSILFVLAITIFPIKLSQWKNKANDVQTYTIELVNETTNEQYDGIQFAQLNMQINWNDNSFTYSITAPLAISPTNKDYYEYYDTRTIIDTTIQYNPNDYENNKGILYSSTDPIIQSDSVDQYIANVIAKVDTVWLVTNHIEGVSPSEYETYKITLTNQILMIDWTNELITYNGEIQSPVYT